MVTVSACYCFVLVDMGSILPLSLSIIVKVHVRNKCSCSVVKKYKNNFANENFTNPLLLHYSKGKCPCSKLGPGNLITQKSKLLIVLLNPNFRKN